MSVTYVVKICLFGKHTHREFTSRVKFMEWLNILIDNEVAFEVDMMS